MSSESKRQNYHIISLIGKGAYGQVYKARKKQTGQFVAIKTIKKKGKQEKDIKAMREQIEILKKLKHPNIVVLLDSFETNSEFIIVTELGQGELFNIIEDDQYLEEPEIRKVAQQLIRALHYIHSNRITHRDLKPQNILMTSEGNIKLCDFGFARYMSHKTEVLTSLKGTPLYMAPEVVQEQPYTHTADLWSLGVILYELSTGSPPFSAANLITLVDHISKDPVRFPETIQGDFKHLLKGLLNKDPNARLGWPDLLNHPFIRETEMEKVERKQKIDKFSSWIEENHYIQEDENSFSAANNNRSFNHSNLDDRSREISPHKLNSASISKGLSPSSYTCSDPIWNNYYKQSGEEKGANQLRTNAQFLEKLMTVLSMNAGEMMRNKEQKALMQCALKVLTQVLMKSKAPESKSTDISKKLQIPDFLLKIMKSILKVESGKNYIQIIADIVRLTGLLAKITFNKALGIEMVYIRNFIPTLNSLLTCMKLSAEPANQTLTMNLLRTVGIFANNASIHCLRSFSFYKDILETKFIPDFITVFKAYPGNINIHKILVQVISAFMHPVYGDIQCFPWRRTELGGITDYNQFATMVDCVKQSLVNGLLEMDWAGFFAKVLDLEDAASNLSKISVHRVVLQSLRLSKEFTENLLAGPNDILKHIFGTLANPDQVIYSTACLIVSHILKYLRERKKEDDFIDKQYLPESVISIVLSKLEQSEPKAGNLSTFGSLLVLQELLCKSAPYVNKIVESMTSQKCLKAVSSYLSGSDRSKLQEMRNIQGSNYGIHVVGYYDPVFLCYHRLITKLAKTEQKLAAFLKGTQVTGFQARLAELMAKISSKTDVSPRGMIAYLMLVYNLVNSRAVPEMVQPAFIKNLMLLLNEKQIEAVAQWPATYGGGQACLQILLGTTMNILLVYLQHAEKQPEILKLLYQNQLAMLIIQFCKHLNHESIPAVITFLGHLLSFNTDKINFVQQFIQFGGMSLFVRFNLLKSDQYQASSLVQSLNLLSQVARSSKQTYEHIESIDPYADIKQLLRSQNNEVKSRALYLLGNMCRHSSYFYPKMLQYELIKQVILHCGSDDKNIRKYSCIALGNAGFHDAQLYPQLRMAMPILVSLLKDSDEKIRSNAAAALGNFARNSQELDDDFVSTGANYQLVNMIINDKSLAAKRVSIMAIINLLELKESSRILKQLNIGAILSKYVPPAFTADPSLSKTAQKALDKLT